MSPHSPSPWVARNHRDAEWGEVRDANGNWVARVHRRNDENGSGAECEANTLLMAAAPELLAALQAAVRILTELTPTLVGDLVLNDARAALAKARGEA